MHLPVAAGAKRAIGFDRNMDAGKMRRQGATIDPPLVVLIGRLVGPAAPRLQRHDRPARSRYLPAPAASGRDRAVPTAGQIAPAEAASRDGAACRSPRSTGGAPQVRGRARSSTGSPGRAGHRCCSEEHRSTCARLNPIRSRLWHTNRQPDSISHSSHDVAVGRVTSRACRRDQSMTSTNAASWAELSFITPSVIGGHRNAPCSSRFQNSTRPEPSHATILILSARLAKNAYFSMGWTCGTLRPLRTTLGA
jgi:hypothetical protein